MQQMDTLVQKQIDRLEDRFERFEDKVDSMKEDIADIRSDIRAYTAEVKLHVAGDTKIVTEIMPTLNTFRSFIETDLSRLQTMLLNEEAKKINEIENEKKKKVLMHNLTVLGTVIGIIAAIVGFIRFKS